MDGLESLELVLERPTRGREEALVKSMNRKPEARAALAAS